MKKLIVVGLAAALAGCVSDQPQRHAALDAELSRWDNCAVSVYVSNRKAGQEKNLAAENAFLACRTEENAIMARFTSDPEFYFAAAGQFAKRKATAKAGLMSAG